jgi:hypothetical protein
MASRLAPCPSCTRHVKVGSSSCPFCGGDVPTDVPLRQLGAPPGKPLTRAAILFASAAAVTACSSSSSGGDAGHAQPAYGGFVSLDAEAHEDANVGGPDAAYGVAVIPDAGQPATHYGGFIRPDASEGEIDAGQGVALYGAMVVPDGGS